MELDPAQEARNAWKPRVRAASDGIEDLPLWPTKSHRMGAGVLGQQRIINGIIQTGTLGKLGDSLPARVPSNSKRVEKKDGFTAPDEGGGGAIRKRRGMVLAGLADSQVEGGHVESGLFDPTSKRKLSGISSPRPGLSNTQQKQMKSYLTSLLRHRLQCFSVVIILVQFRIVNVLSFFYCNHLYCCF